MTIPAVQLSLLKLADSTGSRASLRSVDHDNITIVDSTSQNAATLCLRAAARLRRLADAFVALAAKKEPFDIEAQVEVNQSVRRAERDAQDLTGELTGAEMISAERRRQQAVEGWSAEHDDEHTNGQIIDAALCYVYASFNLGHPAMKKPLKEWPWDDCWWKPNHEDAIPNLTKAGALIAAEIDRRKRLQQAAAEARAKQEK